MKTTRTILVVDDDQHFAESLARLLASWSYRSIVVHDAPAAIAAVKNREIDCALIDHNLGATSGTHLIQRLRELGITFPCIVLTGYGDVRTATLAMKSGASDFIEKPFEPDELRLAIAAACEVSENRLTIRDTISAARAKLKTLTPREAEIVDAIVAGRSSKQIADSLAISQRTVEAHRANILEKLGLSNTASLVRLAVLASLTAQ